MLPAIIYAPQRSSRMQMLEYLGEFIRTSGAQISILDNTESMEEARHSLQREDGIVLMLLGVGDGMDAAASTVRLEHMAVEKNRDSYTLYWIQDVSRLPELVSSCLHPVGFVLPPPDQGHFDSILHRVMKDYSAFTQSEDEQFLSLQMGGSLRRLNMREIEYIEALDKKLNIFTRRQCISVYERLGRLEEVLGERFVRCHRSFLVNYDQIERADFAAMELILTSGARLPISRSKKELLRTRIEKEGLGHAN